MFSYEIKILQYDHHELVEIHRGYVISATVAAATLIATLVLRICLARENHRREHLHGRKYKREAAVKDPCGWVSQANLFERIL
jgi:hypothetical protein